jgi:hypothetical protein
VGGETKRQRVSGSTDENLPYVVTNAIESISLGREFILVLDGDGWKPGAVQWMHQQVEDIESFYVISPTDFLNMAGDGASALNND